MEVREIKEKRAWESFLSESKEKTFLQSWNWGEFNSIMGNQIWRWGIFENDALISVALVVKIVAKRGTFLLVPHGPVTQQKAESRKAEALKSLLEELKKTGQKEKADFIRISPIWERNEENIKIFKNLEFRESPIHIHPEITWELNIEPAEGELLKGLRKTTRYLIRQAQKNSDLEIEQSGNLKDLEIFDKLYQEIAKRRQFTPFSFEYLQNEFLAFNSDNQISIFLGKYQNEIAASGIFIFWQNIGFYHHGASSLRYSKIPVSHLLLWEAIKEAKRRDCQKFNFWGIAPLTPQTQLPISKSHPWAGLTVFKMGFGGYQKEYVKTQDFLLSQRYWLTFIFEKIRKAKRNL